MIVNVNSNKSNGIEVVDSNMEFRFNALPQSGTRVRKGRNVKNNNLVFCLRYKHVHPYRTDRKPRKFGKSVK